MKILIIITKDKNQLLKLIQYNKLIKKAKGKINRLDKKINKINVIGNTNEKFDFIQVIYKKKRDFNFGSIENCFEINSIPYINSNHSFYNTLIAGIKPNYLQNEFKRQIKINKHNIYQYNLN